MPGIAIEPAALVSTLGLLCVVPLRLLARWQAAGLHKRGTSDFEASFAALRLPSHGRKFVEERCKSVKCYYGVV